MADLYSYVRAIPAIDPVQVSDNTAQVGDIIDMQGVTSLMFVISAGTLADADATFTPLVESGDDSGLSDAVAVPDIHLIGTEAEATFSFDDDDKVKKIGVVPHVKRYVRLTLTPANNSGAADLSAVALLKDKKV